MLGGLALEGSEFSRAKPLVLLAYLALEGEQSRAFMAQLLWGSAKQPYNSLAQAIDQIKRFVPGAVEANITHVRALVGADAKDFLDAYERSNHKAAIELYKGHFLEGIYISKMSFEVEEWLLGTRELLAKYMQTALISAADEALISNPDTAKHWAERAFKLNTHAAPSEGIYHQLHTLLQRSQSVLAENLKKEADELGLELSPSLAPSQPPVDTKLPRYANSFFGRQSEQQDIIHMLLQPECQLLTLTGPGGIGKTRLATELSHQLETRAAYNEVHFINLEPRSNPEQLLDALLEALGLEHSPQLPVLERFTQYLSNKRVLLILDNFEQLIADSSKRAVHDILDQNAELNILITSRERLHLPEEWLLPIQTLSQPDEPLKTPLHAHSFDAVKLFVDRAKRANIHFKLTEENLKTVQTLIEQTSGLPLAIELAASWIQALPPEAIADDLNKSLDILSSKQHGDKHQSIETTFEHSWKRLSPGEQTVLTTLSVFENGFDKDAATALSSVSYTGLANLIDKSLLQTTETGRYTLHPLLRQYLSGKLNEADSAIAERKHADYYTNYLSKTAEGLGTEHEGKALDNLALELANIKKAWLYTCEHASPDPELPRQLRRFFDARARYAEGAELLKENKADNDILAAAQQAARAWLLLRLRKLDEAKRLCDDAFEKLEGKNQPGIMVNVLNTLGTIEQLRFDYAKARGYMQQTLELAEESGLTERVPTYLNNLARAEMSLGNYESAKATFETALELETRSSNISGLVLANNNLGNLYIEMEEYKLAKDHLLRGINLAVDANLPFDTARLKSNLARVYCKENLLDKAFSLGMEALAFYLEYHAPLTPTSLRVLGQIEFKRKNYSRSIKLLKESIQLCAKFRATQDLLESLVFLAEVEHENGNEHFSISCLQIVYHHPHSGYFPKRYSKDLLKKHHRPLVDEYHISAIEDDLNNIVALC